MDLVRGEEDTRAEGGRKVCLRGRSAALASHREAWPRSAAWRATGTAQRSPPASMPGDEPSTGAPGGW